MNRDLIILVALLLALALVGLGLAATVPVQGEDDRPWNRLVMIGDTDCNDAVTGADALEVLRGLAGLPTEGTTNDECPAIGTEYHVDGAISWWTPAEGGE